MSLAFEMKTFCMWKCVISVTTHKMCQNANFKNGGIIMQIGILYALLNIFSISLLSRVYDMLFRDAKRAVMSFYV